MMALIFQAWPASGRKDDYVALAASLCADLETIDGFVSVERFQSLSDSSQAALAPAWRDADAIERWRRQQRHRESQTAGRGGVFADYRLRVAHVVRDYSMTERTEVPPDSRALHDPLVAADRRG